jgi:hypothetical protein
VQGKEGLQLRDGGQSEAGRGAVPGGEMVKPLQTKGFEGAKILEDCC